MEKGDIVRLLEGSYSLAITENDDCESPEFSRDYKLFSEPWKKYSDTVELDPDTEFIVMATDCVLPTHMVSSKKGGVKSVQQNTVIIKNTYNGDIVFTQERFLEIYKIDPLVGDIVKIVNRFNSMVVSNGGVIPLMSVIGKTFIVVAFDCSDIPGEGNDAILKNCESGEIVFTRYDDLKLA